MCYNLFQELAFGVYKVPFHETKKIVPFFGTFVNANLRDNDTTLTNEKRYSELRYFLQRFANSIFSCIYGIGVCSV